MNEPASDITPRTRQCAGALPEPVEALRGTSPYGPPAASPAIDLRLDRNEGPMPVELREAIENIGLDAMRDYPDQSPLERSIAADLHIDPRRVLVTNGGDEAIDRLCRSYFDGGSTAGREIVATVPTFEMIERSALLAGAIWHSVPWPDETFPLDWIRDAAGPNTTLVAVVSPNNPTGLSASESELVDLARSLPNAILLVDLAYVEFADDDPTPALLNEPNIVIVRTFSKAYGLAGLRVGWCAGPAPVIDTLRAAGGPFPVTGPSLAVAEQAWRNRQRLLPPVLERVRAARARLTSLLTDAGVQVLPSQANFVFARFDNADEVRSQLADNGIAVRGFPGHRDLSDALRITCPTEPADIDRLLSELSGALRHAASRSETNPLPSEDDLL